jgi:hypothetical protein
MIRATVLYEDKMAVGAGGQYPLHDLVLQMVCDDGGGEIWQLQKLVSKNPRNGIDKLLADLRRTSLIAEAGRLFVLVDRDRIARHVTLSGSATDEEVLAAMLARSDAPEKLQCFFLLPNVEGLLQALAACDPALEPESMARALQKKPIDRDIVFVSAKKAERVALRACVRQRQPGLDALVRALAGLVRDLP